MPAPAHTVTIAQAIHSTVSGLYVLDAAANIAAALPNPGLVARVASFTVSATAASPSVLAASQLLQLASLGTLMHAPAGSLVLNNVATVNVAQLAALEALPGFALGTAARLTLSDSLTNISSLLGSHPGYFAQTANIAVALDGTTIGAYQACQLNGLAVHGKILSFVPSSGHTVLNIASSAHDLGADAAGLNALGLRKPLSISVTNDGAPVSAVDAAGLASLNGFHLAAHTIYIADSGPAIQAHAAQIFGQGFAQIQVTSGTFAGVASQLLDPSVRLMAGAHALLSASTTQTGAGAAALAALPGFSLAGGAALGVSDTASNLAATSPAWLHLASTAVMTADATVTAGVATTLAHIAGVLGAGFGLAGHSLTVSDTLPALLALPQSVATLATSLALAADTIANAAQLGAFAALASATLGGHIITLADTAQSILSLSNATLADSTNVVLTADATISAAGFGVLCGLPRFSLSGHTLTIADTAANLAGLSGNLTLGGSFNLLTSATVSGAQITALAALPGFSLNGNVLTVTDTAANLLSLPHATLALAGTAILSADATVTAAQAVDLMAEPGFSAARHHLTISDTATNLASLPVTQIQVATSLALSANQTVSAAVINELAALGDKFTLAGHTLTCADTAANLTQLSPAAAALTGAEVVTAPAAVSAATAELLAAVPNLSLSSGTTLTVQDSVGNLIAMGQGAPAFTNAVELVAGSSVTITAAQGHALGAIPHFSNANSSITVAGSVAELSAASNNGWQPVATTTHIVDIAANLATSANTQLMQSAGVVTLSANAQISAAAAAQIASIPTFTAGAFQLTIADTAGAIAAHAAAVLDVSSGAIVTDSGPITASTATELAAVSHSGKLSFQGGDQLIVQDSFAALTDPANSAGLALASRISVVDTVTNVAAASLHDWGGVSPIYTLSQGGMITAAQAVNLAGLGSHFSTGGNAISVADTAGAVIGASPALAALRVTASVYDTASHLGAQQAALLGLGSALTSVHITDVSAINAATAASMSSLAAKLSGPTFHVSDTALGVDAALAGLSALTTHVAVNVVDTAADVAPVALDLATLGDAVTVTLADTAPITAVVAAGLAPIDAHLAPNTILSVTDTAAAVAVNIGGLSALGNDLGTISLSGSTTVGVAVAAALAQMAGHFAPGTMLTAVGTGADASANLIGLESLLSTGRLAGVQVSGTSVADVIENATALNTLPSHITIFDTPANVEAGLDGLAAVTGLQAITLNAAGTPALSMSISTLANDAGVLHGIVSPYSITLSDSAANIAHDLGLGGDSVIGANLAHIGSVVVSGGQPLTLTQAEILAPSVDDGPGSILSLVSGAVTAIDVDVAHLAEVASLSRAPSAIKVVDTGAAISADLALGGDSILLAHRGALTSITSSDASPVVMRAADVLAANVDDNAQSVMALLQGAALSVVDATVSQLASLATLHVPPTSISVADTAAHLSTDLASSNSQLIAGLPAIGAVTTSDGGTITLSETQLLSAHVDDGTGSVLSKMSGASLAVIHAGAGDVGMLLSLGVPPTSIAVDDTAAHLISNLTSLESNIASIASISVTSGAFTLTPGEALAAHVDGGVGSLIDKLNGHAFNVSGATVAQLPTLLTLSHSPTNISIMDSTANIVGDLTSGESVLAGDIASLASISAIHGTLTLTDAEAHVILTTPALDAVMAHLSPSMVVAISGAPVSDLPSFANAGWPHVTVAITDTASNITADLASETPSLNHYEATVESVSLSAGGTLDPAILEQLTSLPHVSTSGFPLAVLGDAAGIANLSPAAIALAGSISVTDTGSHVSDYLDALQAKYDGHLSINLTNGNDVIYLNVGQYTSDMPTVSALTTNGCVTVLSDAGSLSQSLVSHIASEPVVSGVVVADTADNVIANLPVLQGIAPEMSILLLDATVTAAQVGSLFSLGNVSIANGPPVSDTASQLATFLESGAVAPLNYVASNGAIIHGDNTCTARDAAALEGLDGLSIGAGELLVWDTAAHLTATGYAAALTNQGVGQVYLKTLNGVATVSSTTATALYALSNFSSTNPDGSRNTLVVSDTAAHIEANHAALMAIGTGNISSIVINASTSVGSQALTDLQSLNAVTALGVHLTLLDTPLAVATVAAAGGANPITPTSWQLSASGSVTEHQAVTLASLGNFNPNGNTVTIDLGGGNSAISSADANILAHLGTALHVNGTLNVTGTVAQLSTLSSTALSLVNITLADSYAAVAALPPHSPLLHGTVEIVDSNHVNASQVESLLGLISSTIAPGALTIDNLHGVYDTVANLRTLTALPAWLATPMVVGHSALVAQDSIANLINPSNVAFLTAANIHTMPSGDETVDAFSAASLAAVASAINYSSDESLVTISDTAAHLLDPANAAGLTLAGRITLSSASPVDAADAMALFQIPHFSLTTPLTIVDNSANLLDGALSTAINNSGFASHVALHLAGPETLDADTAETLASTPGFMDTGNLTIADASTYLLNGANLTAEQMAAAVTLTGDETVSAHTVLRLSEVPHFSPGTSHLVLAGNDFADAATLKAIADEGSAFQVGTHTITMTQDVLNLSPTEFAALQGDHVLTNGHALGVQPGGMNMADAGGVVSVSGLGIAGGTVNVYSDNGMLLSSNTPSGAGFTVTAPENGHNICVTETVAGVEGAPLVILDAAALENAVTRASSNFAGAGDIQVDTGKFVNLYEAGSVPQGLSHAALVYDPIAHTVSLDVPNGAPVTLVTLGGLTHPISLDVTAILIKHHG